MVYSNNNLIPGVGVRGLRGAVEDALLDVLFNIGDVSGEYTLTKDLLIKKNPRREKDAARIR